MHWIMTKYHGSRKILLHSLPLICAVENLAGVSLCGVVAVGSSMTDESVCSRPLQNKLEWLWYMYISV
jgi:hypothetical protein